MTKIVKPTKHDDASSPKFALQRVRVNAEGYDSSGAYWGAGPDVFIATTADGSDDITVRANDAIEARRKVAAELTRQPGAAPVHGDALGGAAPRKTHYEIKWQNPLSAEIIRIRITHARDYLVQDTDHIEIESLKPKRAPLPFTATGYLSHFIPALQLINAGGPVTFVTAWIETEARGKAWQKRSAAHAQADLFQWAAAQTEVGVGRGPKPRPSKPAPVPRKKSTRNRTPE
jgi:hypothetical protein